MANLASDHDAALELVIDEWTALNKINPKNDLLKYVYDVVPGDGLGYSQQHWKEFKEKFGSGLLASMLAKYYVALRDEVKKISSSQKTPAQ